MSSNFISTVSSQLIFLNQIKYISLSMSSFIMFLFAVGEPESSHADPRTERDLVCSARQVGFFNCVFKMGGKLHIDSYYGSTHRTESNLLVKFFSTVFEMGRKLHIDPYYGSMHRTESSLLFLFDFQMGVKLRIYGSIHTYLWIHAQNRIQPIRSHCFGFLRQCDEDAIF